MNDDLDNAHFLFRRHQFVAHDEASCLWCRQVFPCADIVAWIDGDTTPLCPHCAMDFVMPGRLTPEALERIRARAFEPMEGMTPLQPGDWT